MVKTGELMQIWCNLRGCSVQLFRNNRGCCSGNSLPHDIFLGEVCLFREKSVYYKEHSQTKNIKTHNNNTQNKKPQ